MKDTWNYSDNKNCLKTGRHIGNFQLLALYHHMWIYKLQVGVMQIIEKRHPLLSFSDGENVTDMKVER